MCPPMNNEPCPIYSSKNSLDPHDILQMCYMSKCHGQGYLAQSVEDSLTPPDSLSGQAGAGGRFGSARDGPTAWISDVPMPFVGLTVGTPKLANSSPETGSSSISSSATGRCCPKTASHWSQSKLRLGSTMEGGVGTPIGGGLGENGSMKDIRGDAVGLG